ncbi:MAG: hypothetical protein ACOY3P_16985 [Planctomycetota bacterium]
MKVALVVIGNVWLVIALLLVLGRCFARSEPLMYSFFCIGGWYYPATYNSMVGVCLIVAIAHFAITFIARNERASG